MKKLALLTMIAFSTNAYSWSKELTIDFIDVKSNGNVSVYFTEELDVTLPGDCGADSNDKTNTVSWEGTNPSSDNFLSAFLAAKMAKKKVQLYAFSDTCLWGNRWPSLDSVRIK